MLRAITFLDIRFRNFILEEQKNEEIDAILIEKMELIKENN